MPRSVSFSFIRCAIRCGFVGIGMVQVDTMSKGKVNGIKETWHGEILWFSHLSALGAEGRVFESRRPDHSNQRVSQISLPFFVKPIQYSK